MVLFALCNFDDESSRSQEAEKNMLTRTSDSHGGGIRVTIPVKLLEQQTGSLEKREFRRSSREEDREHCCDLKPAAAMKTVVY